MSATANPRSPFDVDWTETIGPRAARRLPLAARLGVLAAREALPPWISEMIADPPALALVTTPVTTASIAARAGAALQHGDAPPANLASQISGASAASAVARDLRIEGPTFCVEAACASSAAAIAQAATMVEISAVQAAVAGGADVQVDLDGSSPDLLQSLFAAMRILDTAGRASPFTTSANGMASGQGAAFVTLTAAEALPEGRTPVAIVSGWSSTFEPAAEHASAADGSAVANLISEALEHAHVRPGDVAAIVAHGTGTTANDAAEAAGIRLVIGERVPVTSLKGHLGHAAYAAGAMNVVAACQTIRTQRLPGLRSDAAPDPRHGINLAVGPTAVSPGPILCLALGLGGFNTAVLISPP